MFDGLLLKPVYNSDNDNLAEAFYNPVLKEAISYDRTSAFFSGKALAFYSRGLEFFGKHGHKVRFIISKDITETDYNSIKKGYELRKEIKDELRNLVNENLTRTEERNISNLAYLIAEGYVDIKMAFRTEGIFHDKCGILADAKGNKICFRGSNNETSAGMKENYESFQVFCSWIDCEGFYAKGIKESQEEFNALWRNEKDGLEVRMMDEVVLKEIAKFNRGKLIVEDILLEDNAMILDYNGQLVLHLNSIPVKSFVESAFYKMSLKSKVERMEGSTLFFNPDLVYIDYRKIGNLLEKKQIRFNCKYYETKRLKDYIDSRNLHIESRSRLGIELKTNSSNLDDKYEKFKNVVNRVMVRPLRERQMRDAFFMYAMTKSGNFSVPGSGKTASALGVYAFLKENNLVDRIVMIGPKNAFGSWIDEFYNCFGKNETLQCFNLHNSIYNTKTERKRALFAARRNSNLLLFNYESLHSYTEELKEIVASRTLLIIDEVHRVKRINGKQASYVLDISQCANNIIAMTGTPIPNTYQDVYNFLNILFHNEYKEFFGFSPTFLKEPTSAEIEIVNEKIQPFFCRTTKRDLGVPRANGDVEFTVPADTGEQKLFEIICKKYEKNKLALFIRLLQLESNPQLLLKAIDEDEFSKVLEVDYELEDVEYQDYSDEARQIINKIEITTKKNKCIEEICRLVNEGKKVIVWCVFKDSIKSIKTMLQNKGIMAEAVFGEVPLEERESFIKLFRDGKFNVLVTNPHTLAESVSLHSICHDAVYFEYSYNLVHLLQSKDRIHRLGLPEDQYTQYYFMKSLYSIDEAIYSFDDEIYNRLKEKEKVMLDAIDNNVLEPVYTTEEDLEKIFGEIFN